MNAVTALHVAKPVILLNGNALLGYRKTAAKLVRNGADLPELAADPSAIDTRKASIFSDLYYLYD
jgi:hypothetical protein